MASDQPQEEQQPVSLILHYIELFDAIANIAKVNGVYPVMINALLHVTAIVLGELVDPVKAEETIKMLNAKQQQFREARIARSAQGTSQQSTTPN